MIHIFQLIVGFVLFPSNEFCNKKKAHQQLNKNKISTTNMFFQHVCLINKLKTKHFKRALKLNNSVLN